MDDMRKDVPSCEFGIYPFASSPKLVERSPDLIAEFNARFRTRVLANHQAGL